MKNRGEKAKFLLGEIVATPCALAALEQANQEASDIVPSSA
jgi:hypothetical protein